MERENEVQAGSECSAGLGGDESDDFEEELCPRPTCGGTLEWEYGRCKHGRGSFHRCMECGQVFNFQEDTGN